MKILDMERSGHVIRLYFNADDDLTHWKGEDWHRPFSNNLARVDMTFVDGFIDIGFNLSHNFLDPLDYPSLNGSWSKDLMRTEKAIMLIVLPPNLEGGEALWRRLAMDWHFRLQLGHDLLMIRMGGNLEKLEKRLSKLEGVVVGI